MSNTLPSIEASCLHVVTGGKTVGADAGGPNTKVLSALTDLQGSIKDLTKPQPQRALGNGNTMMLFTVLALSRPAANNVACVRRRGCW